MQALALRAALYLWAHKKQLAGAIAVGVAAGKAGSGWIDVAIAAVKAYAG
jgi:hypothetical protein